MKIQYLLFALIILLGCSSNDSTQTINRYFLLDRTDDKTYHPNCDEVLPNVDVHWGVNLFIGEITDNRFNPLHTFQLEAGISGLFGNDFERRRQVATFKKDLCSSLDHWNTRPTDFDYSEVFRSVVAVLHQMKSKDEVGQVIIYSDLLEHSDIFCSYCDESLLGLKQNMDSVVQVFTRSAPIPNDLHGIEIVIRHQPDVKHAGTYQLMLQLYTEVFESRGAVVFHDVITTMVQ